MSCYNELVNDILNDCDNKPTTGLEVNAVIIDRESLDYQATTKDAANDSLITNLVCKSSKAGVQIQGLKQLNYADSEVVVDGESYNKFKHGFAARISDLTATNRQVINDMVNTPHGYVVVIEKKWKGLDSESAFVVLGFDNGMFIAEGREATNEADGTFVFKLASEDAALEPDSPKIVLETDYATTKTAFDGGFAGS